MAFSLKRQWDAQVSLTYLRGLEVAELKEEDMPLLGTVFLYQVIYIVLKHIIPMIIQIHFFFLRKYSHSVFKNNKPP